jgi:hypothetical protein
MTADVKPYLVPLDETVAWEPWYVMSDGGWELLTDEIDGWDPGIDLHLARRVRVDRNRLRRDTGIDLADVGLSVSWTSSSTGMTDAVSPIAFGQDDIALADAHLPGERLSGVLELRTTLCLIRRPSTAVAGVASIPGSVLAERLSRVELESRSSMFPIHELDFAATRLSRTASWHLESSTDLLMPFYGTFRVLVNSRDTELSGAVARGGKDKRQQALLDELEAGVAMLMFEIALNLREELAEREDWPTDTVGDVLSRLLEQSDLNLAVPPAPQDLSTFRTQLAGAVRNAGSGRVFK